MIRDTGLGIGLAMALPVLVGLVLDAIAIGVGLGVLTGAVVALRWPPRLRDVGWPSPADDDARARR